MLQETKCQVEGLLMLDGLITYEHLRSTGDGGGIALSAKTELSPAFVRDGGENVEVLTVDINVQNMSISCTSAYGPQENASPKKEEDFWEYLGEEAVRAKEEGKCLILQGDFNAWLGPDMIKGDNRPQNKNGKLFKTFIDAYNLVVVNSLPLCKGVTTRAILRNGSIIESVLDFM